MDGLRGLAVLAVMAFHFRHYHSETKGLFVGGSLGVDIFFVLSGFLITTLLLQEWSNTSAISLRAFYFRRGVRLLPAVCLFLAIYVLVGIGLRTWAFAGFQDPAHILSNSLAALAYVYNWLPAAGLGSPRAFNHLWSLSVEEQFYLFWPLLLVLMLRLRVRPVLLMSVCAVIALASAALPLLDPPMLRLYFGTDFRLQELMAGCVLAQLYVTGLVNRDVVESAAFKVLVALAVGFFIYWFFGLTDPTAFLFGGWFTLTAVCAAILVTASAFVESGLPKVLLANPMVVYVGKRSYAAYLWHPPIYFWLRTLDFLPHLVVAVLLTFAVAELSYRLVEHPALRLKNRSARPSHTGPVAKKLEPSTAAELP